MSDPQTYSGRFKVGANEFDSVIVVMATTPEEAVLKMNHRLWRFGLPENISIKDITTMDQLQGLAVNCSTIDDFFSWEAKEHGY